MPMLVTLSGISTLVSPVQSRNVLLLIVVTPDGIVKEERLSQPENANIPMLVTLSVSVTPVNAAQSEKA